MTNSSKNIQKNIYRVKYYLLDLQMNTEVMTFQ